MATQIRPQLLWNNQPVPYLDSKAQRLAGKEELYSAIRALNIRLNPNQPHSLGLVNLSEWYAPLAPGVYELTIQYRPQANDRWFSAQQLTFEVLP